MACAFLFRAHEKHGQIPSSKVNKLIRMKKKLLSLKQLNPYYYCSVWLLQHKYKSSVTGAKSFQTEML